MQQLVHSRNTYLSYVSLDTMLDPSEGQKGAPLDLYYYELQHWFLYPDFH